MAKLVLTDAAVTVNAVALSTRVKSVTIDYSSDLQEDTAMGATTRSRIGGLLDWTITLEFYQDFAASNVDATLFPLVGTTFTVTAKATSAATSATNPQYSGTGILESYSPISGSIGNILMAPVTIRAAGVLSRLTS